MIFYKLVLLLCFLVALFGFVLSFFSTTAQRYSMFIGIYSMKLQYDVDSLAKTKMSSKEYIAINFDFLMFIEVLT